MDGVERRAQLMRNAGQKFVLQAVDVISFFPQGFFTRQKLVALILNSTFALLALMNVQTIAYVPDEHLLGPVNSVRIEQRRAAIEDPTILAVIPPQPIFHSEFAM